MSRKQTNPPTDDAQAHFERGAAHDLLAAERRRQAVVVLDRVSGPIRLRELAAAIATQAAGRAAVDPGDVAQIVIELHHSHLPRLADANVLTYDRSTGRIEPDERAIARVLDA
ncbi:DUF7344 domain-containing protein [Halovivax cerinus]|uniref:DUF7344 domain-containing protein n=1 Tax=Halovivax cerinus TaxID=1487865 RepID=A0ABD5NJ93_9EURY|nr:hypothetical protein [Halovivax cerinus]